MQSEIVIVSIRRSVAERFVRNVRRLGGDPLEALEAVMEGACEEMESEPVHDYGL